MIWSDSGLRNWIDSISELGSTERGLQMLQKLSLWAGLTTYHSLLHVLKDTTHILFWRGWGKPCLLGLYWRHPRQWCLGWAWARSQEPLLCSHFTASFGALAEKLPRSQSPSLRQGCTFRLPNPGRQALQRRKWDSNFKWSRCQVSFKEIYWL